jgi:hypothetical protein
LCLNQLGRWGQNLSGFFYSHRALIMGKIWAQKLLIS